MLNHIYINSKLCHISVYHNHSHELILSNSNRSDDYGEANVNVVVPDRITTWMGRGFCTNPRHGAGVSSLFPLKVFAPFYLELELPPALIRGETVPVIVHVFDYLEECMVVSVIFEKK